MREALSAQARPSSTQLLLFETNSSRLSARKAIVHRYSYRDIAAPPQSNIVDGLTATCATTRRWRRYLCVHLAVRKISTPHRLQQRLADQCKKKKTAQQHRDSGSGQPCPSCYTRFALRLKSSVTGPPFKVCWANLLPLGQGSRQPVESLVQTVARCGTACLDIPLPVAQAVQAQLVRHLCR